MENDEKWEAAWWAAVEADIAADELRYRETI